MIMKTHVGKLFRVVSVTWVLSVAGGWSGGAAALPDPAVVKAQFISDRPPVPSSHASTICETPAGLLAAWFGGTHEGAVDVGIWLSRNAGGRWSEPEEVANGFDTARQRRFPCWNPVLFQRQNGDLLLFYKVGPSPATWWGMMRVSKDHGQSWTDLRRLPDGIVGPVRSKPIERWDGSLLCGSSSEDKGWRVHMETTDDPMKWWSSSGPLNAAFTVGAIQPTVLAHGLYKFQILCRTKQGRIYSSWSTNNAASWGELKRTALPNPNSAIDAVRLQGGHMLLVYNHSSVDRSRLNVAVSLDGQIWMAAMELENEPGSEFSYPAVIQAKDNLVHVTYTWKRQRIKHVVIDPAKVMLREIPEGRWPAP